MDSIDHASSPDRIICGLPPAGRAPQSWDAIPSELDKHGGGASIKLIAEYCASMKEMASSQSEQVILQTMAIIDTKEQDGVGLDIAIKFGENGRPQQFTILSSELNLSAKEFAARMDEGEHEKAVAELAKIFPTMDGDDAARYLQAVDAYELDGKGEDITIDYSKAAPSISWTLNELESVNDKKN